MECCCVVVYCAHQLIPALHNILYLPLGWLPSLPVMASQLVHTSVCSVGAVSVWLPIRPKDLLCLAYATLTAPVLCLCQSAGTMHACILSPTGCSYDSAVHTEHSCYTAIEQKQTPQVGPSLALIYINNMLANSQCTLIHVPQYTSCTTQLGSVALCQQSS